MQLFFTISISLSQYLSLSFYSNYIDIIKCTTLSEPSEYNLYWTATGWRTGLWCVDAELRIEGHISY